MASGPFQQRPRVVIIGGGVAALESALALHDLAGSNLDVALVAPNEEFVYRPMTVGEPFAYGAAHRYPVEAIARDAGAELIRDELQWLDHVSQTAHTKAQAQLSYDALILALGARAQPRYAHALTIDDRRLDELLHGLVQDVEGGYAKRLAFVMPPRPAWPLPIYELALMTSARAKDAQMDVSVTIVTPEDAPLAIFGAGASAGVSELLDDAGISVVASSYAEVPASGQVVLNPGDRSLEVDRVIALPELFGPSLRGVPLAEHGFIPIDRHCQVRGVSRVYAAGDSTDFPVKHGGLAAQQADTAARAIAALAGVPIEPEPFDPEIHGMLLTGGRPKYLSAHITGGHGFSSEITDVPTWSPGMKIAAKYLAPYLEQHDRASGQASRRS
jgi:sulfide:quinone oxidoreductase